jgi:hypothetical protein
MTPTTTEVVRAALERCGGFIGVVSFMAQGWQRMAVAAHEAAGIRGCGCLHPPVSGDPAPQRRTSTRIAAASAASAAATASSASASGCACTSACA